MYKDLKKIYDERSKHLFSMAISYIVDKGYDTIEQIEITEEQIKEIKGNDFMTADFVLELVKVSKEIVQAADNPTEIIEFCQAVDLYDRQSYCNDTNYDLLQSIAYNAITLLQETPSPEGNDFWGISELCEELGCEPEDLLSLGVIDEDEVDNFYKESDV